MPLPITILISTTGIMRLLRFVICFGLWYLFQKHLWCKKKARTHFLITVLSWLPREWTHSLKKARAHSLDYHGSVIPTLLLHRCVLATTSTSTKNTLVIVIWDSYAVLLFELQCLYSDSWAWTNLVQAKWRVWLTLDNAWPQIRCLNHSTALGFKTTLGDTRIA